MIDRPRTSVASLLAGALGLAGCLQVIGLEDVQPRADGGVDADTRNRAALAGLMVSRGELDPVFDPAITAYTLTLPLDADDLMVTPTAEVVGGASIEVVGTPVDSGTVSPAIELDLGDNTIEVVVTPDSGSSRTYSIAVNRGAGILQRAYIKASNADAEDRFGTSMALDGDTLAVGAGTEDGVGGDSTLR